MFRKIGSSLIIIALMMGLVWAGTSTKQAYAQSSDSGGFPVSIEITGIVASIAPQPNQAFLVTMQDGTVFIVNPSTRVTATVTPGTMVVVVAELDQTVDHGPLVAKTLSPAKVIPTPTFTPVPPQLPSLTATVVPTLTPTPAATQWITCGNERQPVAERLAEAFDVSYEEIMNWHCQGFGFGEIAKAYVLDQDGELALEDIFAMRKSGVGWGQIMQEANVSPSSLAPGQIIKAGFTVKDDNDKNKSDDKGHGKPAKTKKPKKNHGKGNGNGKP